MTQQRYKITVVRENEPENQLSEKSMTLTGEMLQNLINYLMDSASKNGDPWFVDQSDSEQKAWTRITISRV